MPHTHPDYEAERLAARDAARLAATLCMAVREDMLGSLTAIEKAGREPVTVADYGAQAVVLHHIASRFPDDAVLAEERGSDFQQLATPEQRERVARHVGAALGEVVTPEQVAAWLDFGRDRERSRVWVVDPIDGTKGFLRGGQFAVAVALVVDGELTVGALGCPLMPVNPGGDALGIVATAVRGQGAQLEPQAGGSPHPMHVSEFESLGSARLLESVEKGHTDHDFSAQLVELTGIGGEPVRIDSQAKYFAVADGRAEVYLRRSRGGYEEKVWDHAAGALIVQEAGGTVTDVAGQPLDFTLGGRLQNNRGILATSGPDVHEAVLRAIQALEAAG